jgi:anti-sigma factor RsiW
MFDCANVEIREQLPELLHGKLDAAARARVEAHVASCAECAAELELLRAARAAFSRTPAIDAAKIVRQLPRPAQVTRRKSIRWQMAAAVSFITLGGLSLAIARESYRTGGRDSVPSSVQVPADTVRPDTPSATPKAPREVARVPAPAAPAPAANARPSLTFGGGVSDLSDAEVEALLGAIDRVDATPLEDPEHVDVLIPLDTIDSGVAPRGRGRRGAAR